MVCEVAGFELADLRVAECEPALAEKLSAIICAFLRSLVVHNLELDRVAHQVEVGSFLQGGSAIEGLHWEEVVLVKILAMGKLHL